MFPWILLGIAVIVVIILWTSLVSAKALGRKDDLDKAKIEKEMRSKLQAEINESKRQFQFEIEQNRQMKLSAINEELIAYQNEKLSSLTNKYQSMDKQMAENWAAKQSITINTFESELELKKKLYEEKLIALQNKVLEAEASTEVQIQSFQDLISQWKSKSDATIETFKNLSELTNAESHHRIQFNSTEQFELSQLKSIIPKLSNPMPFYKAIYDIYYKNKIDDLVKRVVGSGRVSGIYKLTHIASGKTYVGQSVDISNRWKQHAKRGCGADQITSNKLYPVMLEDGVEAFQFEIVEVVEADQVGRLNELEKYWQNYFQSTEFGFSMR